MLADQNSPPRAWAASTCTGRRRARAWNAARPRRDGEGLRELTVTPGERRSEPRHVSAARGSARIGWWYAPRRCSWCSSGCAVAARAERPRRRRRGLLRRHGATWPPTARSGPRRRCRRWRAGDKPPLYPAMIALSLRAGNTPLGVRAVSLPASVVIPGAGRQLARRASDAGGWAAIAILATLPWFADAARVACAELPLTAFGLLALFVLSGGTPSLPRGLAAGACFGLGFLQALAGRAAGILALIYLLPARRHVLLRGVMVGFMTVVIAHLGMFAWLASRPPAAVDERRVDVLALEPRRGAGFCELLAARPDVLRRDRVQGARAHDAAAHGGHAARGGRQHEDARARAGRRVRGARAHVAVPREERHPTWCRSCRCSRRSRRWASPNCTRFQVVAAAAADGRGARLRFPRDRDRGAGRRRARCSACRCATTTRATRRFPARWSRISCMCRRAVRRSRRKRRRSRSTCSVRSSTGTRRTTRGRLSASRRWRTTAARAFVVDPTQRFYGGWPDSATVRWLETHTREITSEVPTRYRRPLELRVFVKP